jgi:hypothetical protein
MIRIKGICHCVQFLALLVAIAAVTLTSPPSALGMGSGGGCSICCGNGNDCNYPVTGCNLGYACAYGGCSNPYTCTQRN